jgi:Fibronectin type III domain
MSLTLLTSWFAISTTLIASPANAVDTSAPVITITSTTETSTTITLTVSFTSPENLVEYYAQTLPIGPGSVEAWVYDPRIHSVTLTGLTPSTSYDLEIDALCSEPTLGTIAIADTTATTLPPGTPPPPPTTTLPPLPAPREVPKIVSLRPTTTTVTVRWLPVAIPMDKYVITASNGSHVVRTTTARSSARAAIVRGLRPHTHYKILLTAELEQGSTKTSRGVTTK